MFANRQVLWAAYKQTEVRGSCTACLLKLKNDILHACNVGDSGFMVRAIVCRRTQLRGSMLHVGVTCSAAASLQSPCTRFGNVSQYLSSPQTAADVQVVRQTDVVFQSPHQQHSFNFPYQLGRQEVDAASETPARAQVPQP